MTIKELCDNQLEGCKRCPFFDACTLLENAPNDFNKDDDKAVTKSIIETSKMLSESEV